MRKEILINNEEIDFELLRNDEEISFVLDGKEFNIKVEDFDSFLSLKNGNKVDRSYYAKSTKGTFLAFGERSYLLAPKSSSFSSTQADQNSMLSPMPGKILKVMVSVGDSVEEGDSLLVMEAMKMEHTIKASKTGKIDSLPFKEGDLVDGNVELVKIEE